MAERVVRNGCWSFFENPRAAYSAAHGSCYGAAVSRDNRPWAWRWHLADRVLQAINPNGYATAGSDDHDNPAVLVLRADGTNPGRVLLCGAHHTAQAYAVLSSSAGDVTAWAATQTTAIPNSSANSYAYLFQCADPGKTIYWFFRNGSTAGQYNWRYRTSTDGASWTDGADLFGYGGGAGIGGTAYPHFVQSPTDPDRIDCFVNNVHPSGGNNTLYHFFLSIDSSTGARSYYRTDGTLIGTDSALPLGAASLTQVSAPSTSTWVWDAAYEAATGRPCCAFAAFTTTTTSHDTHTYHRALWDGSQWVREAVAPAGNSGYLPDSIYPASELEYSPGICLDPNNIDAVYLGQVYGAGSASNSFPPHALTNAANVDSRIQKWTRSGGTWSKAADVAGAASPATNARPTPIVGAGTTRVLFWGGVYASWGSYLTDLYAEPALGTRTTKDAAPAWNTAWSPAGAQAYYLLNEGTGSTSGDVTGNGYGLTLVGSPTWTASGDYGAELAGFSTTAYARADALAAAWSSGGYPRWAGALFKSTSTAYGLLFDFGKSASTNCIWGVAVNYNSTTNLLGGWVRNDAGTEVVFQASGRTELTDGAWHTVMLVETASNARALYLDGVQLATNSTGLPTLTPNQFTLGCLRRTTTGQAYGGTLGTVVVGWGSTPDAGLLHRDLIRGQFAGTFASAAAVMAVIPGRPRRQARNRSLVRM